MSRLWGWTSRFWNRYWVFLITVAVVLGAIGFWMTVSEQKRDLNLALTAISVAASLLAAIFAAQMSFSAGGSPDIWLKFGDKSSRRSKLRLEVDAKGEAILPLTLENRGNKPIDAIYIRLMFPKSSKVETRAVHTQPPKGMLHVSHPNLNVDADEPGTVEGWIKDNMWPGMRLSLGKHNEIHIVPDNLANIEVKWMVATAGGERGGVLTLEFAPATTTEGQHAS